MAPVRGTCVMMRQILFLSVVISAIVFAQSTVSTTVTITSTVLRISSTTRDIQSSIDPPVVVAEERDESSVSLPATTTAESNVPDTADATLSQDDSDVASGSTALISIASQTADTAKISDEDAVSSSATVEATSSANGTGYTVPTLLDVTLDDLITGMEAGFFTSVDLVNAYMKRIKEVNGTLHAVTELNPDAVTTAADLDAQRANGTTLGPLHGIPILLKNNIATGDSMDNTAGSWALVGARFSEDSTIAAKLRKAGAIILGKSNLSQWEFFRSLNTTAGWSAHGGQTKGAYCEEQDPNGSSSGSAVGTALGLAFAAIGTETMGSIVLPAGVNNVVGIKPTVGLTSRHLVVPISERQDTVGPIARTVKDAAYILQAIAGEDPNDNYTSAMPTFLKEANFTAACSEYALSGKTIGIPYNVLELYSQDLDPSLLAAFATAVQEIKAAGASIVSANFTGIEDLQADQNSTLVLSADFLTALPKYLSQLHKNPNKITSLATLRNWTQSHPRLESYPARDTLIWDLALSKNMTNTDPRFWDAYTVTWGYGSEGGILSALKRSGADAVILPTMIAPQMPALVGSPIISVPMGSFPNGTEIVTDNYEGKLVSIGPNVPFGLSFLGNLWSDLELVGFAYAYEQRTKWRGKIRPVIVPETDLKDVVGTGNSTNSTNGGAGITEGNAMSNGSNVAASTGEGRSLREQASDTIWLTLIVGFAAGICGLACDQLF